MLSPVTRLLRLSGLTDVAFYRKYEYSRSALTAAKDGTYVELPPVMAQALLLECAEAGQDPFAVFRDEYDALDLTEAYENWQHAERRAIAHQFLDSKLGPPFRFTQTLSPAMAFMQDAAGGSDKFAKLLKVPAGTLYRWREGLTHEMPFVVEQALREVHYPYLMELIAVQVNWRDEHVS